MSAKVATALTPKDVARFITRTVAKRDKEGKVVVDADKNPVPFDEPIKADEVMVGSEGSPAIAEYEDRVVVVTTSGEKLTCEKKSGAWKAFEKSQK